MQQPISLHQQEKSFRLPNLFSRYNVANGVEFDQPTNIPTGGPAPPSQPSGGSSASNADAAAAAEAERKRLSNVERFWAEEQARKGKPRVHLGVGAAKAKKKQAYFQAPADPNHAKAMWEKMKTELDDKWSKFQGDDDKSTGPQTERREEKEEDAPTFKKTASVATGTSRAAQQAHAAAHQTGQQHGAATFRAGPAPAPAVDPAERENMNAAAAAAAANRRSTAYAFTNVRKDDLRQDAAPAKPYQYPYASAGRDSTAAHTNKPQGAPTTSQPYSYQPHPPPNPPPSSGTGASNVTGNKPGSSGTQFSSFTRPPQPHSGVSNTSYYFTQQSQAAAAASSGTTNNAAPSAAPPSSSSYSNYPAANSHVPAAGQPHSALFDMFSRWSVKELKRELVTYGVSAVELARLVEKDEFVARCVRVHVEAERKAEIKRAAEAKEAEKENLKDAIVHEVERWAKGRNIKSMLNELNGCVSIEAVGYLKRSDTLKEVSKAYKKALLRVHPDKHMGDESKHLRATEVFKYVSQAFNEYKKKYEK